ncbi:efflux RND transporter periplasmic adaptor subunit [Hyphococcus luteus]|nr:efflux RND transporter periplasmic adaptor subunit [Marinicaulis flavus]
MMAQNFLRAGIFLLAAWAAHAPAAAQREIEMSPASRMALGVETATVATATASEGVSAPAMVIAPNGALKAAASPFDGVMVEALKTPGSDIKAGDPLAVIYSASYADAASELEARRLTMAHMAHLAERADELLKLGLRSEQEADEAHHDAISAQLSYEALQEQLEYVRRGGQPGQFVLTAPAAGIVTHVRPGAGEMIDAGAPVISILAGDVFWARAQVSERHGATLKPGAPVTVENISAKGRIVSVDPEIDPATRSLNVVAELPPVRTWRLGAMLTLSFETAPGEGALLVPSKAIVRLGGADVVFVETEEGFLTTPVDVVSRSRQDALIRGGALVQGDKVAVSGLAALKNIASGV